MPTKTVIGKKSDVHDSQESSLCEPIQKYSYIHQLQKQNTCNHLIMFYGGHTYLFPVLHIGPDPGVASMLFAHQVLINALLNVPHHKQGSTHMTHLHSLLRLIWLLLKLALQMIHHKLSVNMPTIFSLLSFIFFICSFNIQMYKITGKLQVKYLEWSLFNWMWYQ